MEIDPTSSLQEMIEQCAQISHVPCCQSDQECLTLGLLADQNGMMGSMMQDLAFAIPGVDEAMGFAEIMKSVHLSSSPPPFSPLINNTIITFDSLE